MSKHLSYKGIAVLEKPWFMKIPVFKKARGAALFSKIYLRKDLFNKFASGNPDVEIFSVLEHEVRHIGREKEKGMIKVLVFYWLFPKFRAEEEFESIKEEMKVLKKAGYVFDFDKRAENLSGLPYLWAISHNKAKERLIKIWDSL